MEYLAIVLAVSGIGSAFWIGGQRLVTITEMLVQIREQSRINGVAIEAMRIYDTDISNRLHSIENFLEKTTSFCRR